MGRCSTCLPLYRDDFIRVRVTRGLVAVKCKSASSNSFLRSDRKEEIPRVAVCHQCTRTHARELARQLGARLLAESPRFLTVIGALRA